MGSRDYSFAYSACPEQVDVPFSFAPNGASAVDQTTIKGRNRAVLSVTRSNVGVYDVVFRDVFDDLVTFIPSLQLAADADAAISSWTFVPATRTLTLRARTAGAAAEIAANAANRVGGVCIFRNTKVGY